MVFLSPASLDFVELPTNTEFALSHQATGATQAGAFSAGGAC